MTTPTPPAAYPWAADTIRALNHAVDGDQLATVDVVRRIAATYGDRALADVALDCIDAVLLTWGMDQPDPVDLKIDVPVNTENPLQQKHLEWFAALLKHRVAFDMIEYWETYAPIIRSSTNAQRADLTAWIVLTAGQQIMIVNNPDTEGPT